MIYRWAVAVLVTLAAGALAVIMGQRVGATDWARSGVIRQDTSQREWDMSCTNGSRLIIVDTTEVDACVSGDRDEFATYYNGFGVEVIAIKRGLSERYYPATNICAGVCRYSSATDTLVTQQQGYGYGSFLKIYRNVMKNMTFSMNKYTFKDTPPDTYLYAEDGTLIPTRSVGMSDNGLWAAIEIPGGGIIRLDVRTGEAKRITDSGRQYGRGSDPTMELAINNDGSAIVIAGVNSGFGLISVQQGCGEKMRVRPDNGFSQGVIACQVVETGFGEKVKNLYMAFNPRFDAFGEYLFVGAMTAVGELKQVIISEKGTSLPSLVHYLSLGDSYTSGEGETQDDRYIAGTNTELERCHQSNRSYPYLYAKIQGWSHGSVACSGARIHDVVGGGEYKGQQDRLSMQKDVTSLQQKAKQQLIPGRIKQGDFLALYRPRVVTVGIGGNDSGILDKLRVCAGIGECDWVKPSRRNDTAKEIDALLKNYKELFRELNRASGGGQLFAVGYPLPVTPDGTCDAVTGVLFTSSERLFLRESVKRLNSVMASAAREEGIRFIDVADAFAGAELCSSAKDQAMNGLRYGTEIPVAGISVIGSESYHPTPKGHEMLLSSINQTVGTNNFGCKTSCSSSEYWKDTTQTTSTVSRSSQVVRSCDDRMCKIASPIWSFKPSSSITVLLNSSNRGYRLTSSPDGSFEVDIPRTKHGDGGYEMITASGTTPEGVMMELYQAIEVMPEAKSNKIEAVLTVGDAGFNSENLRQHGSTIADKTVMPASSMGNSPIGALDRGGLARQSTSIDVNTNIPPGDNDSLKRTTAYIGIAVVIGGTVVAIWIIRRRIL